MPKRYFSRVSPIAGTGICTRVTRTWVPPAVPAVASLLLAVLWGFAVFGGWSQQAFCGGLRPSLDCADRIVSVTALSAMVALFAAGATGIAWFGRRESLFGVAVGAWLTALAVLFVGGLAAQ